MARASKKTPAAKPSGSRAAKRPAPAARAIAASKKRPGKAATAKKVRPAGVKAAKAAKAPKAAKAAKRVAKKATKTPARPARPAAKKATPGRAKTAPAKKTTPAPPAKPAPKAKASTVKAAAAKPAAKPAAKAAVAVPPVKVAPPPPAKPAPPPPPEKPKKKAKPELKPREIEKLKLHLEEQRRTLLKEVADIEEGSFLTSQSEMSGEASFDEEYADAGSFTFEREKELSIGNNIRDLLEKVNHALQAIERGTYGICENCGDPIHRERLLALPYSTLCLRCKQLEERTR